MALGTGRTIIYGGGGMTFVEPITGSTTDIQVSIVPPGGGVGQMFPNSEVETSTPTVNVTVTTQGAAPPVPPAIGFAIVRDAVDTGGDYDNGGEVMSAARTYAGGNQNFNVVIGQANAGWTMSTGTPTQVGAYRIVVLAGNAVAEARDRNNVDGGLGSLEWHRDSDSSDHNAQGGAALVPAFDTTPFVGLFRQTTTVDSVTMANPADDARYGDVPELAAAWQGQFVTSLNRGARIRLTEGSVVGTTVRDTLADATVSGAGVVGPLQFNVDSAYSVTPADHAAWCGIDAPELGQDATQEPAMFGFFGFPPNLLSTQRGWTSYRTSGHGAGVTFVNRFLVRRTAVDLTIGRGFTPYKDAGFVTPGVNTHDDAARANPSRLFTVTDGTITPHDTVRLQAWIQDAYGNPLNATEFDLAALDSAGAVEDNQVNVNTDANGRIAWEYLVAATDAAFSRFTATPDDPDALGTHHVAIPVADVHRPAGSKAGDYIDPTDPFVSRTWATDPYPARAKDVRITGSEYGTSEPVVTTVDVFGVTSENMVVGMYSTNTTSQDDDANGVPTGPVVRGKPTTAGPYALKASAEVDEGAFAVADDTEQVHTDVAGRPYNHAGANSMSGRRAVFDRTNANVDDAGTNLSSDFTPDPPLGYAIDNPDSKTYDTLDPPGDATTYAYYQGWAGTSAQRNTFGLAAGSTEVPRFTGAAGVFGYIAAVVEYTLIRDDVVTVLTANPAAPEFAGTAVVFTASPRILLPSGQRIGATFDGAPRIAIDFADAAGNPIANHDEAAMVPVAGSDDYEYVTVAPPAGQSYVVSVMAKVGGSRTPVPSLLFTVGHRHTHGQLISIDDDQHHSHAIGFSAGWQTLDADTLKPLDVGVDTFRLWTMVVIDVPVFDYDPQRIHAWTFGPEFRYSLVGYNADVDKYVVLDVDGTTWIEGPAVANPTAGVGQLGTFIMPSRSTDTTEFVWDDVDTSAWVGLVPTGNITAIIAGNTDQGTMPEVTYITIPVFSPASLAHTHAAKFDPLGKIHS